LSTGLAQEHLATNELECIGKVVKYIAQKRERERVKKMIDENI